MEALILILLALLSGCGKEPVIRVKGEVAPITTTSVVKLDVENLEKYYRAACAAQFDTPQEIDQCTKASLKNFLDLFTQE